ncbi:unnamed protein product [Ilex paraguariensis]|uniref:PIG-P domain-containing protein n=1 Tax=Ilex paraguariensis TaxID=185542 RepID=A0ABC8THH6_9AQUA
MEDCRSENSPRRIFGFSNNKRETVFFPDSDEKGYGFCVSGERGPKPSEVYGFVGSISTLVATVIFLVWAYVPESWLHSVGIFYYPSRYWALAVPASAMVTVVFAIGFYTGLNFLATPHPTSYSTMFDEFSRDPISFVFSAEKHEQPIEPIADIGINQVNDLMRKWPLKIFRAVSGTKLTEMLLLSYLLGGNGVSTYLEMHTRTKLPLLTAGAPTVIASSQHRLWITPIINHRHWRWLPNLVKGTGRLVPTSVPLAAFWPFTELGEV